MVNNIKTSTSQKRRLDYLDFCKVLAIFLVTMAHCAQQLSGNKFPNLILSKDSFISVNMAIFMISSGFVMNIDKMRKTKTLAFLKSKAIRLLLPMTSWYLIMCIITVQSPRFSIYWSIYWYLGALFVCLSLIKLLSNYISNIWLVCIMSILVLTSIPMISFERSCYMIPFLWFGYLLRLYVGRINIYTSFLFFLVYFILYYFWDIRYSIYMSPFHLWNIDIHSVYALIFRFIIGVVGGTFVISISRILIVSYGLKWISYIAKFGPYTLVFYTMSFVLNAILSKVLWHTNFYITIPGLLDITAFIVTLFMLIIMFCFQLLAQKNKWTRLILLGEK